MAAFPIGVVIAAARCSGRQGLGGGGKVPPGLRTGVQVKTGGRSLTILGCRREGVPGGCRGLGLGTPSPSDNARPREGVPGCGSWSGETGRAALPLLEALDTHRAATMSGEWLEVSVTFDERGYIGSAPELRSPVAEHVTPWMAPVFHFSARPEPGRLGVRAAYDEITLAVAEG